MFVLGLFFVCSLFVLCWLICLLVGFTTFDPFLFDSCSLSIALHLFPFLSFSTSQSWNWNRSVFVPRMSNRKRRNGHKWSLIECVIGKQIAPHWWKIWVKNRLTYNYLTLVEYADIFRCLFVLSFSVLALLCLFCFLSSVFLSSVFLSLFSSLCFVSLFPLSLFLFRRGRLHGVAYVLRDDSTNVCQRKCRGNGGGRDQTKRVVVV